MRPTEALELSWQQVNDAGITVIGKGALPQIQGKTVEERLEMIRRRTVKHRRIAIDALPGLRETIIAIRAAAEQPLPRGARRTRGKEFIFRWKSTSHPRAAFDRACERMGLRPSVTLGTLRNYALWWWENRLGIGEAEYEDMSGSRKAVAVADDTAPIDRLSMAGHSREVNRLHYRDVPTAEEIAARIERKRGT
ncbi:MAG: hypothetical protein ABIR47_17790, partial [Candidatus Kapaibacterium sp.]